MNDVDEIRLPDGRTLRYRREHDPRGGLRASSALRPQPRPAAERARPADPDGVRGRHLDILV
jgi:hypothetical protein